MIDLILTRARVLAYEADLIDSPAERYLTAYRAAEQVALSVVSGLPGPSSRQTVWPLLAHVAPEFTEWAGFFLAIGPRALAVQAGATAQVTERDAADLVRDAQQFLTLVDAWLRRQARAVSEAS